MTIDLYILVYYPKPVDLGKKSGRKAGGQKNVKAQLGPLGEAGYEAVKALAVAQPILKNSLWMNSSPYLFLLYLPIISHEFYGI